MTRTGKTSKTMTSAEYRQAHSARLEAFIAENAEYVSQRNGSKDEFGSTIGTQAAAINAACIALSQAGESITAQAVADRVKGLRYLPRIRNHFQWLVERGHARRSGRGTLALFNVAPRIKRMDTHGSRSRPAASAIDELARMLEAEGYFNPTSSADERTRTLREIAQREGQPQFRRALLVAYDRRCAVSGCDAVEALEASHISRYLGPKSNPVSNGLLLRADIHTLFDLDLIGIEPDSLKIELAESLRGTSYEEFRGRKLSVPHQTACRPSREALRHRWERFRKAERR